MIPTLSKVTRLDCIPLTKAYYTEEGYLRDKPILTTTGIFEYKKPDGSIRRELRLPEEVFNAKSLASYKGKPIIITHDAGLVDKYNVSEEQIGTILSEGMEDGNNVRAEIVIHDTSAMKDCGLKELSLGYNLELDETPGIWNGEHYDAIQRNIEVNHLALVREARAGDNARLNIDGRDNKTILKGGAVNMAKKITKKRKPAMHNRNDSVLSQEELALAIEQYKAQKAKKAKEDEEDAKTASEQEQLNDEDDVITSDDIENADTPEEKTELVKERKDRRDSEGEPQTVKEAKEIIANQDEDIDYLFDIIDTLLAEKAFKESNEDDEEDIIEEDCDEQTNALEIAEDDEDDDTVVSTEPFGADEDDITSECEDDDITSDDEIAEDEDEFVDEDEDDINEEENKSLNTDSVDALVKARIKVGMIGRQLNMDGLEDCSLKVAKKKIIKRVRPDMRLDGKSDAYINAAFDYACKEIKANSRKDTSYQKKQMFNADSRVSNANRKCSADAARERMIARQRKSH